MGGRNAIPIQLHLQNGNKRHLTKSEIDQRQKAEVRLGNKKLKCPDFVKNDIAAFEKWKELTKLYKDVDFVSSGDVGTLARYCKTFSEYQDLLAAQQRVKEIHYDCKELDDFISDFDSNGKNLFAYKVQKQLRDLFSIGGILAIETAINKKMDLLIKMEDRMFLNPVSKIKNIPKKEQKEEDPNAGMFGD